MIHPSLGVFPNGSEAQSQDAPCSQLFGQILHGGTAAVLGIRWAQVFHNARIGVGEVGEISGMAPKLLMCTVNQLVNLVFCF